MAIRFTALKKTMLEKNVSWYKLAQHGIDNRTLHRLRHNLNVTTNTIDKLCSILNCTPNEIMEFVHDDLI